MRTPGLHSKALLLMFAMTVGCQEKTITLEFIVPNGFSGVLKLRAGSAEGATLAATNEVISLVFPASGTLDIKGKLPTLEWHRPVARFADGTRIPIPWGGTSVPDDVIAIRGLGIKSKNTEDWYLVGKADQVQEAMNKFYGFPVPKR
jgi:hypothetical protein